VSAAVVIDCICRRSRACYLDCPDCCCYWGFYHGRLVVFAGCDWGCSVDGGRDRSWGWGTYHLCHGNWEVVGHVRLLLGTELVNGMYVYYAVLKECHHDFDHVLLMLSTVWAEVSVVEEGGGNVAGHMLEILHGLWGGTFLEEEVVFLLLM
jgi:hypothetical protein